MSPSITTTEAEQYLEVAKPASQTTGHADNKVDLSSRKRRVVTAGSDEPKSAKMLGLLTRKSGCTLDDLQAASGWQAHSVRGFLSGTVRKKLGFKIESSVNSKGVRRYKAIKQDAV